MVDRMGVLLVEQEDGQVSVQLFLDPAKAKEIFQQLDSKEKIRATFLTADWMEKKVEGEVKELPLDKSGERMEYWQLGVGPIFSSVPFGIQQSSGDTSREPTDWRKKLEHN